MNIVKVTWDELTSLDTRRNKDLLVLDVTRGEYYHETKHDLRIKIRKEQLDKEKANEKSNVGNLFNNMKSSNSK